MPGGAWLSVMYNFIIAFYGSRVLRAVDSQPVASSRLLPVDPWAETLEVSGLGERACRLGSGGHAGP